MQAAKFTEVRRSSSIMPILRVFSGSLASVSIAANKLLAKRTSSGPCIFGFTIYTEPERLLVFSLRLRSNGAISAVITPSSMPSGISLPCLSSTAGVVIKWPTLRINSSERPGSLNVPLPSGVVYSRSGLSVRVKVWPPLCTSSTSVPFIKPSQLAYTSALSSPSTAVTESSQSIMVESAASRMTSFTPAGSCAPIGLLLSIKISMCRPLCKNNNDVGASALPL